MRPLNAMKSTLSGWDDRSRPSRHPFADGWALMQPSERLSPNGSAFQAWVPYRLPELLAAEHETVVIVEGEKDADAVVKLGFVATTNAGGAGKWSPELAQYFKGRDVFIVPDNDVTGEKHAMQVAAALAGVAREIRIIRLPGLAPKGDISDWIAAGGTADDLARIMHEAMKPDETTTLTPKPAESPGISLEDFFAYMPAHTYIFAPTRETWRASSVNARIAPVPGGEKAL